jgi:hypothetical protein
MTTAAERKRRQRERDRTTVWDTPTDQWPERVAVLVLTDPDLRKAETLARAAWHRLGKIRGWA